MRGEKRCLIHPFWDTQLWLQKSQKGCIRHDINRKESRTFLYNKKGILFACMCVILWITLIGCSGNVDKTKSIDGEDVVVLRLADNHVEDYPTVRANRKFAELVEERTGGKVKVKVFAEGQLGDEISALEQVEFGVIDLVRTSISPLVGVNREFGALMLPYLYRDREHMFKVLDGPLGDRYRNMLLTNNIYGLAWYDAGARNFYNSKVEVRTPHDMKGLKIRVQEAKIMTDLITELGAIPVPMVFSEVYSGIKADVIQGGENNWSSYLSTANNEVAKYVTVDEHTRIPELIVINKLVYDKLTKEQQVIIEECAKEAALFQREEWAKSEETARKVAIEKGSIITELTASERELFRATVMPIYDDFKEQKNVINQIINTIE